jgi:diamine N-acetyltransferase
VADHAQPRRLPRLDVRLAGDALCLSVLAMQVFLDTYATRASARAMAREVLGTYRRARLRRRHQRPDSAPVRGRASPGTWWALRTSRWAPRTSWRRAGVQAELLRLYVQEPFTGAGSARACWREAEQPGRRSRRTVLWLTPWVHNHRALAFYARRGYADHGPDLVHFEGESHDNRGGRSSAMA